MSHNPTIKQTLTALFIGMFLTISCKQKSVHSDSETKEQTFSITQLYPSEQPPLSNEADRLIITGTIAETDFNGGVFVVRTVDGNVGLKFDPKRMETSERESLKRVLTFGNQIKCVGTKIDMALFTLLAAKITVP